MEQVAAKRFNGVLSSTNAQLVCFSVVLFLFFLFFLKKKKILKILDESGSVTGVGGGTDYSPEVRQGKIETVQFAFIADVQFFFREK
jgi:hypothetical protein